MGSAGWWAAALSVAVAATGAEAAAQQASERPVVSGCTQHVTPFCVGIVRGGTTYTLFGANPQIPIGIGADVWGTVGGVSPCFGTVVQVTRWRINRRLACR